jgi:SAM-dependent methyltransferase
MYPATYRARNASGLYGRLKYLQALMLARRLRSHLGHPDGNILELGCGAGQLLLALRNLGFSRLCGVDWTIPPEFADNAPSVAFVAQDITCYVPPGPLDVLIINNVIEHVSDPRGLLERYRTYLAEHGSILLLTPNAQSLSHRVFGRYWSGLHSPWHVHVFTRDSLAVLAQRAGFQIRETSVSEDPGGWAISLQNRCRSRRQRSAGDSGFSFIAALALVCFAPVDLLAAAVGRGASLLAILQPRAVAGRSS